MTRFRFARSATRDVAAAPRIFCDGSADETYREGVDLELSHWVPNRTPARYKADTSTAICLAFAADPLPGEWPFAINNHLDTDGVLSAFALTHREIALAHREVLIQAATMGDFMGWGDAPAQRLYQRLGLLKARLLREKVDPQQAYERCFEAVAADLEGDGAEGEPERAGLEALRDGVRRIETGEVARRPLHERLVAYSMPVGLSEADLERARRIPGFDAILSDASLLLPQARARFDAEGLHLVSTPSEGGWLHDLWLPGYVWAETPDSWRPPGLVAESSNAHRLERSWSQAAEALQRRERGRGRWTAARRLTPFEGVRGRGFPVALAFLRRGAPAVSSLTPETVGGTLVGRGIGR